MDSMLAHRGDNRLLAGLPPKTFDLLRPALQTVSIGEGRSLYEPGDDIEKVYFPQSGLVSFLAVTKGGHFIDTLTVGRDGAVGLQAGLGPRRSFTRASVQIAGNFSVIHADRFAAVVKNDPTLRDLIPRYIELLFAEAQQNAACNATHDASARFCRWLLQCADRLGSDEVALTQEFLGQMLGVRRTTVTLFAHSLQDQGFIKYRRGHIQIIDRPALKYSACECYDLLHYDKLQISTGIKLLGTH